MCWFLFYKKQLNPVFYVHEMWQICPKINYYFEDLKNKESLFGICMCFPLVNMPQMETNCSLILVCTTTISIKPCIMYFFFNLNNVHMIMLFQVGT